MHFQFLHQFSHFGAGLEFLTLWQVSDKADDLPLMFLRQRSEVLLQGA